MPDTRRWRVVAQADDVPPGARLIVEVPGLGEVGIFNVGGEYFSLKNVCPHQGGPMCKGDLTGTTRPRFEPGRRPDGEWIRDGEILRCPWHAWEFDIRTGKAVFSGRTRIATYEVHVADNDGAVEDQDVPGAAETYPVRREGKVLALRLPS